VSDQAQAARAAGKAEVREQTVWLIEAAGLATRCLEKPGGQYEVQVRTDKGWRKLAEGGSAAVLLAKTAAYYVQNVLPK
jgi:hypothetical protein